MMSKEAEEKLKRLFDQLVENGKIPDPRAKTDSENMKPHSAIKRA